MTAIGKSAVIQVTIEGLFLSGRDMKFLEFEL